LLLISKLFSCRDGSSPFTLVLDSLHHSGKPLLQEYIRRASVSLIHDISAGLCSHSSFARRHARLLVPIVLNFGQWSRLDFFVRCTMLQI